MKLDYETQIDLNAFKDGKSRVVTFDITEGLDLYQSVAEIKFSTIRNSNKS